MRVTPSVATLAMLQLPSAFLHKGLASTLPSVRMPPPQAPVGSSSISLESQLKPPLLRGQFSNFLSLYLDSFLQ